VVGEGDREWAGEEHLARVRGAGDMQRPVEDCLVEVVAEEVCAGSEGVELDELLDEEFDLVSSSEMDG